ncbi:metallophosphoesterase family protein [Kineococcus auxinigenes]|uniref:metallophosphoesterase family protein n=1 Tax=unclassified Kineococcus TaxID=2621656 RepID=UPI003D7D9BC2
MHGVLVVAVACTAAVLAVLGAGAVHRDVGPVRARLSLVLASGGGTHVALPPVGRLTMDTHSGPLALRVGVQDVDLPAARGLLTGAVPREDLVRDVGADVRSALRALALRSTAVALLAGALACAVVFRDPRAVAVGVAAVLAGLAATGAVVAATARPQAITRPTYTGLLAQAPALVGAARNARTDFGAYSERLAQLASDVTRLYARLQALPETSTGDSTRLLWISDVHNNPQAYSLVRTLVAQYDVRAVVDTGDSTDLGTDVENRQLAGIADLPVPYLWVRGNHDSAATQAYLAALPNVRVLDDGATTQVAGLRFAGTGDPRFTPVKRLQEAPGAAAAELARAGQALARAVDDSPEPVDVALVHEPAMAPPLHGHVPLVLDGHVHERRSRTREGTLELTQGSSGGAGLRMLDGGRTRPLEVSVLHFDPATRALVAVDEITVAGLGEQRVVVERRPVSSYGSAQEAG